MAKCQIKNESRAKVIEIPKVSPYRVGRNVESGLNRTTDYGDKDCYAKDLEYGLKKVQRDIEVRAQNEFKIRKIAHLNRAISKSNSVERIQTNKKVYNPYGNSPMNCTTVTMAFNNKKRNASAQPAQAASEC